MSQAQENPFLPRDTVDAVPGPRGDFPVSTTEPAGTEKSDVEGRTSVAPAAKLALAFLCLFSAGTLAFQFWGQIRVFPGVAALAFVVCALTLLFGYWVLRRIRPVRPPAASVSLIAVAWGFTGAAGLALMANNELSGILAKLDGATAWEAALTGPFNEELLKLVGIVLIALAFPRVVRGPVDGFVIGALAGLGFQGVENFLYALISVIQTGAVNGLLAATLSSVVRVLVTGLGTHWALSALTGTAVGLLAASGWRPDPRRAVTAALLVVTAIGLHLLFNSPLLPDGAGILLKVLLNFTVVMVLYFVIRRSYRRRVLAALAEEGEKVGMERSHALALARRGSRRKALRTVPESGRAEAARRQEQLIDAVEARAVMRSG
ncbi:PrsW family intramembrane metalloprotease [Nocardiopsis ansamitocini]|uniref:PrsW family intramembrane metalloprotease n=1 Tax=Nocardiopsis ansamitocini TaxID=1670832 RepID=A0A9W6PAJ7_9ACTN|nr:PrsW family intramembrane metalloprotease [Nocardiopsis ansamitocini]GLU50141.1 hypothetical protein Nans01_44920 [Nocardiopsis ansamitocini]